MSRWLSLIVLLLVACSAGPPLFRPLDAGDGGGAKDGGTDAGVPRVDGGLPLAQACDVLIEQRCLYLARCGLVEDSPAAMTQCTATLAATWCGTSAWLSRVQVGTLRYDALKALACAEGWSERSCQDFAEVPEACNRFLLPNVTLQGACYGGYFECIEGVCRGGTCPRTCQQRALSTEVCHEDTDCRTGLYCRYSSTSPGIGQCSLWGASGTSCDERTPCGAGLECQLNFCVPLPQAGEPCPTGRCDEGSFCQQGSPGVGLCLTRKNRGAPCTQTSMCLENLVCEPLTGLCESAIVTQAGALCGINQTCSAGSACVGRTTTVAGVCQQPLPAAEACLSSLECAPQLACTAADAGMTCGVRAEDEAPCTRARDCQLWATCVQGRCARLPTPGQSCAQTQACLWGRCLDADGGRVCFEPGASGELCGADSDCASSRCTAGRCAVTCSP